jgi:vacuolar-type H+-ATPase subunit H
MMPISSREDTWVIRNSRTIESNGMNVEAESDTEIQKSAHAMRVEAASQLKSARKLAKKVRAEAVHELEDARTRVKRIATREEEMAARWAKLLEAEQIAAGTADVAAPVPAPPPPPPQIITTDAPGPIAEAQAEAAQIIEQAGFEARQIREEAMRLLGMAEGEKAESHEIAQSETQRAMSEAERLRAEAEAEAKQLLEEAQRVSADSDDGAGASIYSKRGGRKLPRIGEGATSVLSQMSDLRAKSADDEDRKVV